MREPQIRIDSENKKEKLSKLLNEVFDTLNDNPGGAEWRYEVTVGPLT